LYKKLGFCETENPGKEFQERWPKGEWWRYASGEIRMRLDVQD
jgi:hypothetical protein